MRSIELQRRRPKQVVQYSSQLNVKSMALAELLSGIWKGALCLNLSCWLLSLSIRRDLVDTLTCSVSNIRDEIHPTSFSVLRPQRYAQFLKEDYQWAIQNVPFIDFPDNDDILTAYYYRWRMYRKHIKYIDEEDIYVITEFLPQVSWSGLYNTIPAAAGHHIMEGRWIHDQRILNDYIQFWYSKAIPVAYTNWIGHAAWQRYLLNGNATFIKSLQEGLDLTFQEYYISKYLREITINNNSASTPCWWQDDGRDAMEVSISGSGCRPTIASAMYGEAETLAKLARMNPTNRTLEVEYTKWQELSRSIILEHHWNEKIQSFAVIPTVPESKDDELSEDTTSRAPGCDLSNVRKLNETVNVRELLGFMPWYFDTLIPDEKVTKYDSMWNELFDPNGFHAVYGLRSAELRHPCYNYSYDHGDCWNGPSWPYETSRVLTGYANLLNREIVRDRTKKMPGVTAKQYWYLLKQYARQHTRTYAVNDTANPIGSGHIFENLHPDLGYWNNRQRMYESDDENKNMGDDYNHSTFVDLILSGLFGIRPQEDGSLIISPLIPNTISAFAVDNVLWQGQFILSLIWDKSGKVYNRGQGLLVLLDGNVVASSRTMKRIVLYPKDWEQEEQVDTSSISRF